MLDTWPMKMCRKMWTCRTMRRQVWNMVMVVRVRVSTWVVFGGKIWGCESGGSCGRVR